MSEKKFVHTSIASSRTPKPAQARLKSLAPHTVFGLGLYLSARALTSL